MWLMQTRKPRIKARRAAVDGIESEKGKVRVLGLVDHIRHLEVSIYYNHFATETPLGNRVQRPVQPLHWSGDRALYHAIAIHDLMYPGNLLLPAIAGRPPCSLTSWIQSIQLQSLAGGALADNFTVVSGSVTSIDGGLGVDSLIGPNAPTQWRILGPDQGQAATSGNASIGFSAIENLAGGASNDIWRIEEVGQLSGTLHGGTGRNTLDYSSWTSAVTVNLDCATPRLSPAR